MQCKDIPTRPILEFLRNHGGIGCHWYEPDPSIEGGHWRSVRKAMPPGLADKLVLAKMRSLVRRGLVDGCTCGCRGDWELTEKGEAEIAGGRMMPPA